MDPNRTAVLENRSGTTNNDFQSFIQVAAHLPVASYLCNNKGYIIYYNNAAKILWGREPELEKACWCGSCEVYTLTGELLSPQKYPVARAIAGNIVIQEEKLVIQRPDKTKSIVIVSAVPLCNSDGIVAAAIVTLIPMVNSPDSDEKQAMLAAIVDTSDDTIISKTLQGMITSWNRSAERMFGYTEQEALGKHISLIIPPDRLQEEDFIIGNVTRGNKIDHFETIRLSKSGEEIPISLSVSPILDTNGNIIGASKIARDISEKRRAEEKQAMLAAIVDTSDDTIISKTLKGIITSWNKAAQRMFGYTEQEVIGKHISILIPPERLHEEDYIIGNIAQGNKVDHFETIRVAKDGHRIPISLSVSPVKDHQGNIIGASKIARDITLQREAREAAIKYTRRLEDLNSVIKAISEELDLQTILQRVTDATTELTGAQFGAFFYNDVNEKGESYLLYTLSGASRSDFDTLGMPRNTDVFHPTFSGQGIVRIDDIRKDPRYGHNPPHNGMPQGHLPVVSYLAAPVISRTGGVIGGLFWGHPEAGKFSSEHESLVLAIASQAAVALDNARLYEDIKILNEKKDEFIGLASHELKTPLTSISGYLQIMDRMKSDEKSKKFLAKTINQVKKLSSLVSDLLDVSKIEAGKLELSIGTFDVMTLVDDAVELIQHSQNTHQVVLHADIIDKSIKGDPQRIEQVIVNLLTNAIKYSPGAERVDVMLKLEDGQVKIGVKDYGFGIEQAHLTKIFSRFYRVEGTNPNISGLGIGLYLSHEIIERHHGRLWVESVPGEGSTFWVTLPA